MPIHSQPFFHQELAALRKLEKIIWPDGPVCPHCGANDRIGGVTGKGARPGLKFCCHCRKQFRATIGTIFEGSHVPLHKWLQACFLLMAPQDGISAHQLHRHLGVTYKTALWMVRRLQPAVSLAVAEIDPVVRGGGATAAHRRVRWRRRKDAAGRGDEATRAVGAGVPDDCYMVPWVYPPSATRPAFGEFAELARGLGCRDDEESFDEVLRRISPAAPSRQ